MPTIRTNDYVYSAVFYVSNVILKTQVDSPQLAYFANNNQFSDAITQGAGGSPIMSVPIPPAGQVLRTAVFEVLLNMVKHDTASHGFAGAGPGGPPPVFQAVDNASPFTPPEIRIVSTMQSYVAILDFPARAG